MLSAILSCERNTFEENDASSCADPAQIDLDVTPVFCRCQRVLISCLRVSRAPAVTCAEESSTMARSPRGASLIPTRHCRHAFGNVGSSCPSSSHLREAQEIGLRTSAILNSQTQTSSAHADPACFGLGFPTFDKGCMPPLCGGAARLSCYQSIRSRSPSLLLILVGSEIILSRNGPQSAQLLREGSRRTTRSEFLPCHDGRVLSHP